MLSAFTNCLKIPELRQRIFLTLALLFVARVGALIPLPGLNPKPLHDFFAAQSGAAGTLVNMYNMFTGGAFLKGAIFGLGIMPYISASIIMQLLGAVVPSLARLQQEGDIGRQKLSQYTRYMTILICLVQGVLLVLALSNYPGKLFSGFDVATYGSIVITGHTSFLITSTIFLTAGSVILMWLGEQITQRGIGNGISLLITIGILSGFPSAVSHVITLFSNPIGSENVSIGIPQALLMIILLLGVIAAMTPVPGQAGFKKTIPPSDLPVTS